MSIVQALVFTILATAFPSSSKTAWMQPAAFHLALGMPREKAVATLESAGWEAKPGKAENHLIVEYDNGRTVTLAFEKNRLQSIRFEYVAFIPELKTAFQEQQTFLENRLGPAKKLSPTILAYDRQVPSVFLVLSTDAKSSFGRQGVGFLVVRYFEPPAE